MPGNDCTQNEPRIDLRCCSAEELIASLEPGSVDGVIADPPWKYGSPRRAMTLSGLGGCASAHYSEIQDVDIAQHLSACAALCSLDAYLVVFCTWPKWKEWSAHDSGMPWRYVTGGAWCKSNGFGVGFHHAGDSEFWLVYVKGSPRPADGRQSNAVVAPRLPHSEKPQAALERLVKTVAPKGGTILDPYAGASASLARACRRLGRNYIGAEIDPERHRQAMMRLEGASAAQAKMKNQPMLFGSGA